MRQFVYIAEGNQWSSEELLAYPNARVVSEVTDNQLMLRTALGVAERGDEFVFKSFGDIGATLGARKELIDIAAAMGVHITSAKSKQTITSYEDYVVLLEDVSETPKERKTKLSRKDLEEIRRLNEQGLSQHKLAKRFNVTQPTIGRALAASKHHHPKLPDTSEE